MKFEDIKALWEVDKDIDEKDISSVLLDLPKLHFKYANIFFEEKLLLYKAETDLKILKKDLTEFYVDGYNEEALSKKWTMPPKGRIAKIDALLYIEADPIFIEKSLKVGMQKENVEYVKHILEVLKSLQYSLRTALEDIKFRNGS